MPRPEDLAYYKRLRACQIELNGKISCTISKNEFEKNGEALGIRHRGVLVFDSEDIVSVFTDYNIYKLDNNGRNAIHRWIEKNPPSKNSMEKIILEAMSIARYSIFKLDSLVPGYGVITRDILRGDGGFITDVGLSHTGMEGMLFAGRILAVDPAFSMTTGGMLPFDKQSLISLEKIIFSSFKSFNGKSLSISDEEMQIFETAVIKMLIANGVADRFRTEDIVERSHSTRFKAGGSAQSKLEPSRNAPCPCGSGLKYKKCCMKKQDESST